MSKDKYEKINDEVPRQTQDKQPGIESKMTPQPIYDDENLVGSGKLQGKNALITGGDSGIDRAFAIAFDYYQVLTTHGIPSVLVFSLLFVIGYFYAVLSHTI